MKPENLDLKKLKAFELVAKEGSLRMAAQRLNLTTSAVSFCVRRLEEDLGVELFKRFANKMVLTIAGQHLLRESQNILSAVERAVSSLPTGKASNDLSVAVCNSGLISYITPRMSSFMHRFPNTKIALLLYTSMEALALVDAGKLDLCLGRFTDVPDNFEKKMVFEAGLTLACSRDHPIVRGRLTIPRLAQYPLITMRRHTFTRCLVEQAFSDKGCDLPEFVDANNCHTALTLATQEAGIAVIHSVCTVSAPEGSLSFVEAGNLFQKTSFHAVYRKGGRTSAIEEVLGALTADELH